MTSSSALICSAENITGARASRVIWEAWLELADERDWPTIQSTRQLLRTGNKALQGELGAPIGAEPEGIQHTIADRDKVVRTGSAAESVRDAPPAGAWNDISGD